MKTSVKLLSVLCVFLLSTAIAVPAELTPAAGSDLQSTREAFVAAMQRIRQNLPEVPDSSALAAYSIHDYLVAARFRRDLIAKPGDDLDTAIDVFLQTHAGQPVARALRHDWLVSLAQERRWDKFLPRSADATDPLLICDRLNGRLATGDTQGLAAAALARWVQPQKQPPECNEVFAWLRQQNLLTAAVAETKVRAALAADNPRFAREAAADVPAARTAPLQWSDLLEAPKGALTVLASHPALPVEPDALAAGFEKLAHMDSAGALNLLPMLLARPGLNSAAQARLQRAAALGGAYDRDPRALSALGDVSPDAADAQVQEWRARVALWHGDYDRALNEIEHMPAGLATQLRWRYWRARSVEATAGTDAAAPLFGEIADQRDYYGYLAADRLHRGYNLNARPSADDPRTQAEMAAGAGMTRAHELIACDQWDDAVAEWSAAMGGADPATKVQAAHLASRWGWYAESIATLAQAGEWDDVRLRYPRPYPDEVADASRLSEVPADWIFGVMRQESLFRKDAVSRADARGLMQMLPATAIAVARRWRLPPPRKDSLFDPPVALPLGAAYLRELLDRHGGRLVLALAAYNAGSTPVARWLPTKSMDADIWIENVPYAETRAYIQHILEHVVAIAWVRDAEPPRLASLMSAIEPPTPIL